VDEWEWGVLDLIIGIEIEIGLRQCPAVELDGTSRPSGSGSCDSRPVPRRTGNRTSGNVTQMSPAGVLGRSSELENQDRWQIVRDEAAYLVEAGLRDAEELAHRLGFTGPESMERFFYRHAIPIPYKQPRQENEPVAIKPPPMKTDTHPYQNTADQLIRAARVVRRHGRADAVPELLAMLGLPTEQQLIAS